MPKHGRRHRKPRKKHIPRDLSSEDIIAGEKGTIVHGHLRWIYRMKPPVSKDDRTKRKVLKRESFSCIFNGKRCAWTPVIISFDEEDTDKRPKMTFLKEIFFRDSPRSYTICAKGLRCWHPEGLKARDDKDVVFRIDTGDQFISSGHEYCATAVVRISNRPHLDLLRGFLVGFKSPHATERGPIGGNSNLDSILHRGVPFWFDLSSGSCSEEEEEYCCGSDSGEE